MAGPRAVLRSRETELEMSDHTPLFVDTRNPTTMKPVCNDHLYSEIYHLWIIQ